MNPESKTTSARDWGVFERGSPRDVVQRDDLTREEKLAILREWELDLREGMVAEEENMPAPEPSAVTLDQVLDALRALSTESQTHDVAAG